MNPYYFDYNATTPLVPEAFRAMEPFLKEQFGNPSSTHAMGKAAERAVGISRRQVACLIGASDDREVVFTSGGTESNHTAIRSALEASEGRKKIVTSTVEHSSVRKLCDRLEKEGYEVCRIPVDRDGALSLPDFRRALDGRTAVVTLMMANNESGVIFPVAEWAEWVKACGSFFHVDAIQAPGKLALDVARSGADFISFAAHKCYGPKGVGALYVRHETKLNPLFWGGAQERGRRAGTENVAGIVGFGAACEWAGKGLEQALRDIRTLRDRFEDEITRKIPGSVVQGRRSERLPNTSLITFTGIDAEALLYALDQKNICVSMGSACLSGSNEPSHVLTAMGASEEEAKSSLRFSFGRMTHETEVTHLIAALVEWIKP
ncbi:MAG: cysteine desulfurase family protein [Candidatus Omnitrophota bacterium]